MQAEELISLAAAHGIDLMRVARSTNSKNPEIMRAARDVKMKRFAGGRTAPVLVEPPASRARGKETQTSVRPEWTIAEIGHAAHGLSDQYFRAALFAFAGDRTYYKWLRGELFQQAILLRGQHDWPWTVEDIHEEKSPYLRHLSKLVLDQDATPNLFVICPELYAIYLRIPQKVWDKSMSMRFLTLQLVWQDWYTEAARAIQPRLRQQMEEA